MGSPYIKVLQVSVRGREASKGIEILYKDMIMIWTQRSKLSKQTSGWQLIDNEVVVVIIEWVSQEGGTKVAVGCGEIVRYKLVTSVVVKDAGCVVAVNG